MWLIEWCLFEVVHIKVLANLHCLLHDVWFWQIFSMILGCPSSPVVAVAWSLSSFSTRCRRNTLHVGVALSLRQVYSAHRHIPHHCRICNSPEVALAQHCRTRCHGRLQRAGAIFPASSVCPSRALGLGVAPCLLLDLAVFLFYLAISV